MTTKEPITIEVEQMLFGDYRVCVWKGTHGMLDKDYFCRGLMSAYETALEVKRDLFPDCEIMIRTGPLLETADEFWARLFPAQMGKVKKK